MNNVFDLSKDITLASNNVFLHNLHICLQEYAANNSFDFDWDREDGEQWGRVLCQREQIIIFHSELPIVFVQSSYNNQLVAWFQFRKIIIKAISIPDWKSKGYIFTSQDIVKKLKWSSYQLGVKFSINDLWYSTL